MLYRVYGAKQNANSQNALGGGDGVDTYSLEAAGFRMDGYLTGGARWDVSGDFQTMHANLGISLTLPDTVTDNYGRENNSGQALRGRYIQPLSHGGDLQIQAAFAHTELDMGVLLVDLRNTFDIDAQHHFKLGERHDIVWGGGYRLTTDSMPTTPLFSIRESSRRTGSYGVFGQDEMTLTDDWRLTLGLRMDHNEFTGWEAQPDARLSWHLAPNHTLWGALSKASRSPSRGEQGSTISFIGDSTTLAPGLTVPNVLRYVSEGIPSEQLKATQMGLRSQWAPVLSTDMVLFSHKYDHLSSFNINDIQPVPHMVGPYLDYLDIYIPYAHQGELTLNGAEMAVDWRPSKDWNLRFSQTWQDVVSTGLLLLVDGSGSIPHQITSLHASWMPTSAMDINFWLRRTGGRPGTEPDRPTDARHAFYGIDLSATWRPQKNLELSLIGQNLNDGVCGAYANVAGADMFPGLLPTCMPRSLSGQLRLNF